MKMKSVLWGVAVCGLCVSGAVYASPLVEQYYNVTSHQQEMSQVLATCRAETTQGISAQTYECAEVQFSEYGNGPI